MDRRRPATLIVLALAAALTATLSPGCSVGWERRSPIRASSFGQGLTSALPGETPVPAVIAAARDVLSERGYVVTEASATQDHGRVLARPGYEGLARETTVTVRRTLNTTEVRVASGTGVGVAVERDVLEQMLTRLGL